MGRDLRRSVQPFACWLGAVGCLLAATGRPEALQGSIRPLTEQVSPVSPSVVATVLRRDNEVVLLLLWRGRPGGFLGPKASNGGGSGSLYRSSLSYGEVTVDYSFDTAKRIVAVRGVPKALADSQNVVLVDDVDGPRGATLIDVDQVTGSLQSSTLVDSSALADLFRASKKVPEFLRCEIALPNPLFNRVVMGTCDRLATLRQP